MSFGAAFFVAGLVDGPTTYTAIFLVVWFVGSIIGALAGRAAFPAHPRMAIAAVGVGAPLLIAGIVLLMSVQVPKGVSRWALLGSRSDLLPCDTC